MINIIRIPVKFDSKPSLISLDVYSNSLINAVDDYCNNRQRSYITEEPSKEQRDKGDFVYRWEIEVGDCFVDAQELFNVVNPIPGGKVLFVDVRDKKYDPKCNKCKFSYYRYNERFCAVAFINGFNRACPYEYNEEKNNWEYRKPSWCPLRQLEAETNGAFTFGGK